MSYPTSGNRLFSTQGWKTLKRTPNHTLRVISGLRSRPVDCLGLERPSPYATRVQKYFYHPESLVKAGPQRSKWEGFLARNPTVLVTSLASLNCPSLACVTAFYLTWFVYDLTTPQQNSSYSSAANRNLQPIGLFFRLRRQLLVTFYPYIFPKIEILPTLYARWFKFIFCSSVENPRPS